MEKITNWAKVREEYSFPRKNLPLIYFSQCSLAITSNRVLNAQIEFLRMLSENPSDSQRFFLGEPLLDPDMKLDSELAGWNGMQGLKTAFSQEIGAEPEEVYFTDNTTHALEYALEEVRLKPGDNIVTTDAEYCSLYTVLSKLYAVRKVQIQIADILPTVNTPNFADNAIEAIATRVNKRTKAVVLSDVLRNCGVVLPVEEITRACKEQNLETAVIVDGAQSFGHIPVNVNEYGCDAYATCGHKWIGSPTGVGMLFAKDGFIHPKSRAVWEYMQTELPNPRYVGAKVALDLYQTIGSEAVYQRSVALAKSAREILASVPGLRFFPEEMKIPSGIVSFSLKGRDYPELVKVVEALEDGDQRISCTAIAKPSLIRIGLCSFNNEEEVEILKRELLQLI